MSETTLNIINDKVKKENLGEALDHLQNVAEQVLDKRRWRQYLIASNKDANECDGMDGLLINGEYFDWKEFEYRKNDIVKAYLRYFSDEEISNIAVAL